MRVRAKVGKDISYYARKACLKFGDNIAKEATDFGVETATKLYQSPDLDYDGTVDNIKIYGEKNSAGDYILYAEGPQVAAIEYGSGDYGRLQGRKMLVNKEGQIFWFYKVPVGNKFRTEYGAPKKVLGKRYRKDPSDPKAGYYKNREEARQAWGKEWDADPLTHVGYSGKEQYIAEREEDSLVYRQFIRDGKKYYGKNPRTVLRKDDPETGRQSGLIDSSKYGYTRGNKPNNVMQETKDEIIKHLHARH